MDQAWDDLPPPFIALYTTEAMSCWQLTRWTVV
jgi:hypothetical protein